MQRVFYAANAMIWVLTLASSFTDQSTFLYEINMGFLAGASLCLVVAILMFSSSILNRLETGVLTKAEKVVRLYRKITLASVALVACFGFRFAAIVYFLYVDCDELSYKCVGWLYPTFYYFGPEMVPYIAVILAMAPRKSIFSIERCATECCPGSELEHNEFSQFSALDTDESEKKGSEREPLRPELEPTNSDTF